MFRLHSVKSKNALNASLQTDLMKSMFSTLQNSKSTESIKDMNYIGSAISVNDKLRETNGIPHIQTDSTCWKSATALVLNLSKSLNSIPNKYLNKTNMMVLTSEDWTNYLSQCGFQKEEYPETIEELAHQCYTKGPLVAIINQDLFKTGENSNIYHLINVVGVIDGKPIIVENETRFFPTKEMRDSKTKYCHVLKDFNTLKAMLTSPTPIMMPWEVYMDIPAPCRPIVVINNKITNNPPRNQPVVIYPGIHSLFSLSASKAEIHAEKLTSKEIKKITDDYLSEATNYPNI